MCVSHVVARAEFAEEHSFVHDHNGGLLPRLYRKVYGYDVQCGYQHWYKYGDGDKGFFSYSGAVFACYYQQYFSHCCAVLILGEYGVALVEPQMAYW